MEESKECKRNGSVDHNERAKARENKAKKSSSFRSEAKTRKTKPNRTPGSEKMSRSDAGVTEEKPNCHVNKLSPNPAQRLPSSASVTKCNDIIDEVKECDPSRIAVSVESTTFQKWGRMNGTDKVKYRSIMFKIKDPNDPDFRRKVLPSHVHVKRDRLLLNMTTEEMASDERQLPNQQIKEQALSEL